MHTIVSPFVHKWVSSSYLTDVSLESVENGLCAYRIRRVQNVEGGKWEACRTPNWHLFYSGVFVGFMSKESSRWGGECMSVFKFLSGESRSVELVEWIRRDGRRVVDGVFDELVRKVFIEFRSGRSSFVALVKP